jgi:hypothetical protein
MKTKNKKITTTKKARRVSAVQINMIIAIVIFAAGFAGVFSTSLSFADALHEVLHKIIVCLQQKADHILEIVVIIILASIKGIANRFED